MNYLIKDPLYQIIQATSPKVQRPLEQFAYDSVGNWVGGGRIHNELNQLAEDDSNTYSYDADGNMTEKVSKANGDTTHFTWDIESKLTEVRKPGVVVRYVYDALGRRVSKEVNGVVTQFRYDGEDLILEMNGSDSITANYTFGPGIDNPLQMHRDGRNFYYVKDGLGSVTVLTDSLGSVVHEYAYSVFGEIIDESGESVKNPFTYTAREWEPEVGLYFYRARYYDPEIGRFLSEDPIGLGAGDANFYRFVFNNSLNYIDPLGLWCIPLPSKKERMASRFVRFHKEIKQRGIIGVSGQDDAPLFSYVKVDVYRIIEVQYLVTQRQYCCEQKCTNSSCGSDCKLSCSVKEGAKSKEKKEEREFLGTESFIPFMPFEY